MDRLLNWVDRRTGYRRIIEYALYENIPGGARWRYIWGSTLVFCLSVQFITGLFLWMSYSPSSQTAWESVYYIQNEMTCGWLLRGIHHFTASVMNVLLVLHLMQVVIDGAYKAPREMNFWFGLGLLQMVLGLSLTGYLLPWDQKGYWATKVATSIMGQTPIIGRELQQVVVGGNEYGHATLTRFFALHAAARPEWYFLFLYQFLKFFPGNAEIIGSMIIPGLVLTILALFPIFGRWNYGHRFNCIFLLSIGGGAALLTFLAIAEDRDKEQY